MGIVTGRLPKRLIHDMHPVDHLIARLDDGERLIAEARAKGQDVTRLEDHWMRLLSDYTALLSELDHAA